MKLLDQEKDCTYYKDCGCVYHIKTNAWILLNYIGRCLNGKNVIMFKDSKPKKNKIQ